MSQAPVAPSVLVVDDNILVCRTLVRLLKRSGYTAHCIESGQEALDFLQNCQPAVVFLDIMMPGVSGFDVLRSIRNDENCSKVIVFMYSAVSDPDYQRRAREMGADEYIVKGAMDFDSIQKLVHDHLSRLE